MAYEQFITQCDKFQDELLSDENNNKQLRKSLFGIETFTKAVLISPFIMTIGWLRDSMNRNYLFKFSN